MRDFSIAVLGVGGVGGCIAAVLAHRGARVTCVAREQTAEVIRTAGLALESRMFGSFVVHPKATGRLDQKADVLFVTTKAPNLVEALERVDPAAVQDAVVIPLLNGLEHLEALRSRFGHRVAAGSIRIEARRAGPARIVHASPFLLVRLASDGDIPGPVLDELASFLSARGMETEIGSSEAAVLWEKLARLAALACTTALADQPVGFIRRDPVWRGMLEAAVREAVAVAHAAGVTLSAADQLRVIDGMPDSLTSSLQRDIAAGAPSELDAIAGAVVRAGRRYGLRCAALEDMIARIEAERIRPCPQP